MTFDDLLDETFVLATGKTRASARRTKRYKQLRDEAPHIGYTTSDEVSEMLLLGEMIADRAFATLPLKLRKLAKAWPNAGHSGQVEILQTLFQTIGTESLPRRHEAIKRGFNVNESLPAQYGKWEQNDLSPNCLGMAQILVGFARAAGAPHMIVDALRRYDMYVNEYRCLQWMKLRDLIKPYSQYQPISSLLTGIEEDVSITLSFLASTHKTVESHSLLSIKTDEEWWIMDPYMNVCCKDDYDHSGLEREGLIKIPLHPQRSFTVVSHNRTKELIVECHMNALREYLPYLDQLDKPRSEWTLNNQGRMAIQRSLAGGALYKTPRARFTRNNMWLDLCMRTVYPRKKYVKILLTELKQYLTKPTIQKDLLEALKNFDRTKRLRNRAFVRLMAGVAVHTYNRIFDIDNDITTPAFHREYMHPTMQLAVKTVSQLATNRKVDAPQLIKFGTNQWLIYNMLQSVERSGIKRHQQILARKVRNLGKNDWAALPQLRPHLSQSTGGNDGEA